MADLLTIVTRQNIHAFLTSGRPSLLLFGNLWCPSCKESRVCLRDAARRYEGLLDFGEVDCFVDRDTALDRGVSVTPTTLLMTCGGEVGRLEGLLTMQRLGALLRGSMTDRRRAVRRAAGAGAGR